MPNAVVIVLAAGLAFAGLERAVSAGKWIGHKAKATAAKVLHKHPTK